MTNYRKEILPKILAFVLVLVLAYMIQSTPDSAPVTRIDAQSTPNIAPVARIGGQGMTTTDFREMVLEYYAEQPLSRSPAWYQEHCDYLPLIIADYVPDGLFINCK